MSYNHSNDEINEYIQHYNTDEKRVDYCKFALDKYRFEKYKLTDTNINPNDRIIQDVDVINKMCQIINNKECSVDDFKHVLNSLSPEELCYIGF